MKRLSKINETIWGDINRRSQGQQIRKEDETGNLSKLKPVDMGGSILWADDDLIVDGNCYFTYDEATKLVSGSNWRIPTLEEVAELDKIYKKGAFYENTDRFTFDGFPDQLVFFKKGLIYVTANIPDQVIDEDYYYCWTDDEYDSAHNHILTFDNDHPIHSPTTSRKRIIDLVVQNKKDKLCVRLVKDL